MSTKIGIGIDIGTSAIKIAKLSSSESGCQWLEALLFPLEEDEPLSAAQALSLKSQLQQKRLRIRSSVVGISGPQVNIRYLHAPSLPAWRLARLVAQEVEDVSEKSAMSVASAYMPLILPSKKTGTEETLLVAIARNAYLDRVSQFLTTAGIGFRYFVPNPLALYNAFVQFCEIRQDETVCLVDVGEDNTDLVFCWESYLYFAKNLGSGSSLFTAAIAEGRQIDLRQAESYKRQSVDLTPPRPGANASPEKEEEPLQQEMREIAGRMADSLESSRKFAQTQIGLSSLVIDRFVFTGGGSRQKGLPQFFMSRFGRPVSALSVPSSLLASLSPETRQTVEEQAPLFSASVGLAQLATGQGACSLQLISERKRIRDILFGQRLFEYASMVVAVLFLTFAVLLAYSGKRFYEQQRQQLSKKMDRLLDLEEHLRQAAQENRQLRETWDRLAAELHPNSHFLAALTLLRKQVAAPLWILSVSLEREREGEPVLSLQGAIEESQVDVFVVLRKFRETLASQPGVKTCEVKDPKRDEDEGRLYFTLRMTLGSRMPPAAK